MIQLMRNLVLLLFIALIRAQCQDAAGNPVIFNVSPSALAGDVIYLQGSGFGASPRVEYSFNDSNWIGLSVLTSGSNAAMVELPASQTRLPDLITIHISPDGYHWSTPVYVNQAKALSFDTNQVGPGNSFRIFGRNLMYSRTPTVRLVDTSNGSNHWASVNTNSSSSFALAAYASSDIQPGHTYSVYVSNGYNGNGSSGGETLAAGTLQGRASGGDFWNLGVPWAADLNFTGNVYNVQTDPRLSQHASGNGSTADAGILTEAINAAANDGGGIVYLPSGTYTLYFSSGCGLTIPSRVVLMGAGAGSTYLNFGYGSAPSPGQGGWSVCFVGASQSGASDITFNNVNQSGAWPQSGVALNSSEIFLQRTVWNIGTAQWLALQNNANLALENSQITQGLDPSYNGPLTLQGTTNFEVSGNTIKYVAGAIPFDNANGGVVENNTIIRDASQSAPWWIITHVIVGNFTSNLMLFQNKFQVIGGTLSTRNDGETIGTEAGGQVRRDEFRGTVQWANSNSIWDGSQNFNWSNNNAIPNLHVGAILAIVSGQGAGQWATITGISSDGHTVWVNQPFAVVPGVGSTYATFDWSSANWIVANNTLSDNEKGIEFFSASIRDILITNNSLTNNGEILVSPTEQPDGAGLFNLVLNTQILNNTLVDNNGLRPAAISGVSREDNENNNFGTGIIGLEIRGNSVTGANPNTLYTDISLDDYKARTEGLNLYWQWQTTWSPFIDSGTPSILGSVIQNNTLNNSSSAIYINSLASQTVLSSNTMNNVGTVKTDNTVPGASHASVGTVIAGFTAPITTPGPNPPNPGPHQVVPNSWNQVMVGSYPASTLTSEPSTVTSFPLGTSLYQIGNGGDSLSMLAEQISSDITAIARITIPGGSDAAAEGLLMFRDSTSPTGAFVSIGVLQNGNVSFQWRCWDGAGVSGYSFPVSMYPVWVKLVKSGNLFQAYFSSDGMSWQYAGEIGDSFSGSSYLVGLASLSDTVSGPPILFDNVSVP